MRFIIQEIITINNQSEIIPLMSDCRSIREGTFLLRKLKKQIKVCSGTMHVNNTPQIKAYLATKIYPKQILKRDSRYYNRPIEMSIINKGYGVM